MVCCRCNRSSKCRQCACVKVGRTCSGCLLCQIGTCHNTTRQDGACVSQLGPTQSTPVDSSPSQWAQVIPEWPLPALEEPNFTWGNLHGADLLQTIYDKVIHWHRNLFQVLSGFAGKAFIAELAWLYEAYADCSNLEMQQ